MNLDENATTFSWGLFALALLLTVLLLACGGSDEPTEGPFQERATAEPTDMPDSERPTDEPETPASPHTDAFHVRVRGRAHCHRYAYGCDSAACGLRLRRKRTGKPWLPSTTQRTVRTGGTATNWLSDAPLGEWTFVHTDDDGRVAALGVPDNNLSGEIPGELGQPLQPAGAVSSSANNLSGEIPAELGSLPYLGTLDLGGNALSGEIPPELGSLANLRTLETRRETT